MSEENAKLFEERRQRVETAIALGTPDRVPVAPYISSYMQRAHGSSYRDLYYDYEKAGEAAIKFYEDHPMCDMHTFSGFTSGRANELANSQMIDWPGRPGTSVSIYSSHQVIEREFMTQEEYPEMLDDFTGFMLRKYIPRAFPSLKAFSEINLRPTVVLSTSLLAPLTSPDMANAYQLLNQIGEADREAAAATAKYRKKLTELGFPTYVTGVSEAPYDILGDYFRGTMGIFEDLIDEDMQEYMERACDMFADQQIQALQYLKYADMPVKRVFFPLHKAMDGFMNGEQYERLYWKPLKKIMMALIEWGVTPYIYTEGPYDTRLEYLTDVPKGKVLYHFEKVNMKEAKRILGGTACISGNLSASVMEFGKKEEVIRQTRQLLDDCMPGGGYLFDFNALLENCKPENLDAMFETLDKYGKY
ncbi:MAG: hypothetical protein LUD73_01920 [Lachnospiraceae bacterium]|nr:hypothetical protein [Lachnospiraceae bacterium]MCD8249915.1 hypothetical protein [Lachnospiraceae bacterium]